jgi:hypothetical protein
MPVDDQRLPNNIATASLKNPIVDTLPEAVFSPESRYLLYINIPVSARCGPPRTREYVPRTTRKARVKGQVYGQAVQTISGGLGAVILHLRHKKGRGTLVKL